jgi:Putative Flp pilus-assembly TadE/G-like/Carboxypeptidase regulatory-like domain
MNGQPNLPLGAAREREHGQILVLFAFILIGLLLVSALAVDYGGWLLARRTYQNVADEAALAGAAQLTNPIGSPCSGTISSKNQCARQAAWTSVKNALGLAGLDPPTQATASESTPYADAGFRVWVASPPSDAGAVYTGLASSQKTVFVRVERTIAANFARIIQPSETIGSWATAGRIPRSFAIVVLCTTSCHGSADDLKVNGGSTLILAKGDIGSNSYVTTNGGGSYVALGSDSSAYMNQPSNCTTTSVSCQLVGYDGTNPVLTTRYSGQALPQVVDPQYAAPTMSSTAVPWQCSGIGSISMADGPIVANADGDLQPELAAAVLPPTNPPVMLGANVTISGRVSELNSSPTNYLNVITITATAGANTYTYSTQKLSGNNGSYTFSLPNGVSYTLTAHDPSSPQAYADAGPYTTGVLGSGASVSQDFTMAANPGTISGTVTGPVVSGITISTDSGSTTTTGPTGTYTLTGVAYGSRVVTPTAPSGYVSTPTSRTVALGPGATVLGVNFVMSAVPTGTVTGTVTDAATTLPIPGVSVAITQGAGVGKSAVTNANGVYTINSVPTGNSQNVTGTLTGYESTTSGNFNVTASNISTVNLQMPFSRCGTGGNKGNWSCSFGSGTCGTPCEFVTGTCVGGATSSPATVSCSKFDASNEIRPGTYNNITIGSGTCAWIDPLGSPTGTASGQTAGVVHVTGTFQIGSGGWLFGDGVTIVLDSGASMDFKPSSGFVVNYEDDSNTYNGSHFRTGGYIGGGGVTYCSGDSDSFANYQRGAWTTKTRATWTGSGTSWCYTDTGSNPAELGMTWYLRGADTSHGGGRFNSSSSFSFLFSGVLYGPQDDIGLAGSPQQAAAGQIVAWTLTYSGGTTIYQSYNGLEVDGPPYLIEPYLGE